MADEAVAITSRIESIIEAIKAEGKLSKDLIIAEAESIRNYDKEIAVRELAHKAAGMPVTLIGHQAKGDASGKLYDMIVAQKTLKAHWQRLKYLQAHLTDACIAVLIPATRQYQAFRLPSKSGITAHNSSFPVVSV